MTLGFNRRSSSFRRRNPSFDRTAALATLALAKRYVDVAQCGHKVTDVKRKLEGCTRRHEPFQRSGSSLLCQVVETDSNFIENKTALDLNALGVRQTMV
jgi:hypothetical protein